MACNCADEVDAKLVDRNIRLERAIVFGDDRDGNPNIMLRTIGTERGKPKSKAMFLTFCPFCGVKYSA